MAESEGWREAQTVADAFLAETKAQGARALLLVDNLDLILDALSPEENWALRRALQAPGGPALYGASTHVPHQTADRSVAFYEFFRLHLLEPLSADDLICCLRRLAQVRGASGERVSRIIDAQPERLRALHAFTGGNPRVLALTYRLLESEDTDLAFKDLEVLLDQTTPFYKGRIEEYQTKQQRAVIDAIALNWDPITSHDLATATATEGDDDLVATLSPPQRRPDRGSRARRSPRTGHQMAERFFNIWYLMRDCTRRTRNRVSWLTKFLVWFYPADDLQRMAAEKKPVAPATDDRAKRSSRSSRWRGRVHGEQERRPLSCKRPPNSIGDNAADGAATASPEYHVSNACRRRWRTARRKRRDHCGDRFLVRTT